MTLKFKTDQNMPFEAAELLRSLGYDCETVGDEQLLGADDEVIAAKRKDEGCVIVTLDTDFSDIRRYPPDQYAGIIVLRVRNQVPASIAGVLARIAPMFDTETLQGCLWVCDELNVRIRGKSN
jgi:predicted nuclease of predicted toxin-antitoxin system